MQGESNDNSLQVFEAWAHCEKGGSVKVLKYWTYIKDCCVFFFSKVGLTHTYTKLHKIIYMTTKSRGKKKRAKVKQKDANISYGTSLHHRKHLNIQVIKIKIGRGWYNMLNKQKTVL